MINYNFSCALLPFLETRGLLCFLSLLVSPLCVSFSPFNLSTFFLATRVITTIIVGKFTVIV
jgi:hypothetical protein